MAIGSAPEVGIVFSVWGQMDEASRQAWFDYIRENWKDNILAGYATIHYAPRGADYVWEP